MGAAVGERVAATWGFKVAGRILPRFWSFLLALPIKSFHGSNHQIKNAATPKKIVRRMMRGRVQHGELFSSSTSLRRLRLRRRLLLPILLTQLEILDAIVSPSMEPSDLHSDGYPFLDNDNSRSTDCGSRPFRTHSSVSRKNAPLRTIGLPLLFVCARFEKVRPSSKTAVVHRNRIGFRTDFKSGFFVVLTQSRTRLTKTQFMKMGRWDVDTLPIQNLNFTIDSFIDHGRNTVDSASSTRYYAELHPKHDTIHTVVMQIDNQKRQKNYAVLLDFLKRNLILLS